MNLINFNSLKIYLPYIIPKLYYHYKNLKNLNREINQKKKKNNYYF